MLYPCYLCHHYASQLGKSHPEEKDDDDQVSSPPAKKPRTSDPGTSQCECACLVLPFVLVELSNSTGVKMLTFLRSPNSW